MLNTLKKRERDLSRPVLPSFISGFYLLSFKFKKDFIQSISSKGIFIGYWLFTMATYSRQTLLLSPRQVKIAMKRNFDDKLAKTRKPHHRNKAGLVPLKRISKPRIKKKIFFSLYGEVPYENFYIAPAVMVNKCFSMEKILFGNYCRAKEVLMHCHKKLNTKMPFLVRDKNKGGFIGLSSYTKFFIPKSVYSTKYKVFNYIGTAYGRREKKKTKFPPFPFIKFFAKRRRRIRHISWFYFNKRRFFRKFFRKNRYLLFSPIGFVERRKKKKKIKNSQIF